MLGRRLAELHVALATPAGDPAFAAEPIGPLYLRSVYRSLRTRAGHVWRRLNRRLRLFPPEVQADARALFSRADELNGRYRSIMSRRWSGQRIRVHGDLHLGQVLITGSDVAFIHFGGDLASSPSERQQKHRPCGTWPACCGAGSGSSTPPFTARKSARTSSARRTARPWSRGDDSGGRLSPGRFYRTISPPPTGKPSSRRPGTNGKSAVRGVHFAQRVNELAATLSQRPEVVQAHVRGLLAALSAAEGATS